jgi:hypothetical protein
VTTLAASSTRPTSPIRTSPGDVPLSGLPHFVIRTDRDLGLVAEITPRIAPHLAEWFLVREQFEPVTGAAGLYRLTDAQRDGIRRARQTVKDLRNLGYTVHTDRILEPADTGRPRPALSTNTEQRRGRLSRAAAAWSPQTARARTAGPLAPTTPAVAPAASSMGRSR